MISEYDLSGMDMESAKEYVLAVIITLKQTIKRIETLSQEKQVWQSRVKLAEQKGAPEMRREAEKRVESLTEEIDKIKIEAEEYSKQADILKRQLSLLKIRTPSMDNLDMLLAQLSLLEEEPDKTAESFREFEAQAALEALKKKLSEESE